MSQITAISCRPVVPSYKGWDVVVVARIMSCKKKLQLVLGKKVLVSSPIIVDTNVQSYVVCMIFQGSRCQAPYNSCAGGCVSDV